MYLQTFQKKFHCLSVCLFVCFVCNTKCNSQQLIAMAHMQTWQKEWSKEASWCNNGWVFIIRQVGKFTLNVHPMYIDIIVLPVSKNPSCLQATLASLVDQNPSQMVPQVSFQHSSTRPSYILLPPISLMSPLLQRSGSICVRFYHSWKVTLVSTVRIYNVISYTIARKSTAKSSNNFQLVASSVQYSE